MRFRALFLLALFVCGTAHAKYFHNSVVMFELPAAWACKAKGRGWICKSTEPGQAREAVIALNVQTVGLKDSLADYLARMETPTLPSRKGEVPGQIIYGKERKIGDQLWVDSLRSGGAIGPHYFTRYLATTKGKIALLVTFIAHKSQYTKYSGDFVKAIETLKLVGGGRETFLSGTPPVEPKHPEAIANKVLSPQKDRRKNKLALIIWPVLIVAASSGFFYYQRKRAQAATKNRRSLD